MFSGEWKRVLSTNDETQNCVIPQLLRDKKKTRRPRPKLKGGRENEMTGEKTQALATKKVSDEMAQSLELAHSKVDERARKNLK